MIMDIDTIILGGILLFVFLTWLRDNPQYRRARDRMRVIRRRIVERILRRA